MHHTTEPKSHSATHFQGIVGIIIEIGLDSSLKIKTYIKQYKFEIKKYVDKKNNH
jgi:hypothetical protein